MFVKDFFNILPSTVYDPAWYQRAETDSTSKVAKWFFLMGIVGTVLVMIPLASSLFLFSRTDLVGEVIHLYPPELEITVASGTVSINQQEPYAIKNPYGDKPTNIVVFDTKDTLKGDAQDNNTLILVKKTYMLSGEKNNARVSSFSSLQATTTVVTRTIVETWGEMVRPYVKPVLLGTAVALLTVGTLSFALFWMLFHMLYLCIPALVLFLLSKMRPQGLVFSTAYMRVAYASIPVAILSYLVGVLGLGLPTMIYTLLVLGIAYYNLVHMQQPVSPSSSAVV